MIITSILLVVHWHDKQKAISRTRAEISSEYLKEVSKLEAERFLVEKGLRDSLYEAIQEKDYEIKTITDRLDNTLVSLQQLRSKYEANSNTRLTCPKPPTEFYREDGEFLAREAARAERVLKERDFYYERYEETRKALGGQE